VAPTSSPLTDTPHWQLSAYVLSTRVDKKRHIDLKCTMAVALSLLRLSEVAALTDHSYARKRKSPRHGCQFFWVRFVAPPEALTGKKKMTIRSHWYRLYEYSPIT